MNIKISHKKGGNKITSEKWMKPILNFNTINYKNKKLLNTFYFTNIFSNKSFERNLRQQKKE